MTIILCNFIWTSYSEQCSDRLQLEIISILVNFSCELGPIIRLPGGGGVYGRFWAIFEQTPN